VDWNSTTDPDTVALAVIRLPARVPVTDPQVWRIYSHQSWYNGRSLLASVGSNSCVGGSGASGVDRLLEQGSRLQKILDSENDSFDRVSRGAHCSVNGILPISAKPILYYCEYYVLTLPLLP
jgi:hypothetical protein